MNLIEALQHATEGNAVLFLGSGFSRSAKNVRGTHLRTGGQLAEYLSKECGLAESAPLDDVADLYIAKHGTKKLVDLLVAEFQVSELGPEHPAFGSIPWKRIYTTNYDNTIEFTYKATNKPIVPIALEDNIRRVREAATQCVHINGFIDNLTDETLFSTFKLTDTSYSSSLFDNSAWSGQFRHDIAAANAVLFVGYSAYDLDIKRILLETPENARKIFFVVGADPTEVTRHKLSRFGRVEEEDCASLSEKILTTLATYVPREHTSVSGQHVVPISGPAENRDARDRDVFNLFLWGKVNRDLVWSAVSGSSTVPYVCSRDALSHCLQMLEDGERNIVVRSDLGNGKTIFLECLGAMAATFGYAVLYLGSSGPSSVTEVETAANCDVKTLLLVDSYTTKRAEVEALAHHRSDDLHVIYAARSLRHDVAFEWLFDLLEVDSIPEIDLDRLSDDDCRWFCETLDKYGLWGVNAAWSTTRKLKFLGDDCSGRTSAVLIATLSSPTMANRLKAVLNSISSVDLKYLEAIASVLALSVTEIGANLDLLSNLVGPEILNQAGFRNNEAIRELLDFDSNRITAKSAVIGKHILTTAIDPNVSVSALAKMAANADKLKGNDVYYVILRDLMRFSNVQSVLPSTHRMNAVVVYYERLKNLGGCQKNPNFWLQYAIARLALSSYDDARVKLATAYSHAKARPGYNTYMIDNTFARLELEELVASPTDDREVAIGAFRKARGILNSQVSKLEYRHYPYRVATKYQPFLATHRSVLSILDQEEIARAARFILRRIEGLSRYRARHRYVVDCRQAMAQILEEIALPDS